MSFQPIIWSLLLCLFFIRLFYVCTLKTSLFCKFVAGLLGFEPRRKVLETLMLPLHHSPMVSLLYRVVFVLFLEFWSSVRYQKQCCMLDVRLCPHPAKHYWTINSELAKGNLEADIRTQTLAAGWPPAMVNQAFDFLKHRITPPGCWCRFAQKIAGHLACFALAMLFGADLYS